ERFVVAYLGDASFMRHRVGQRVTQALGRANREPSDRSMYLGLDPLFARVLADNRRSTIHPRRHPRHHQGSTGNLRHRLGRHTGSL
ncbi:hypothetical protein, partial [Rhodococcus sp. 05-2254-6]